MGSYYCLMTGLPDITLESGKSAVSLSAMKEELDEQLTKSDKKVVSYFFLENDCANLVTLLKDADAELKLVGNYSKQELAELIELANASESNDARYPVFMSDFVREYDAKKGSAGYFPEDIIKLKYYEYAQKCSNKMVADWAELNHNIANILTAMIAKNNGWDVADYVLGDNNVSEMILANTTKDFNLSKEYDYIAELMSIVDCDDPVMKEKKIDAFKWIWLDEATFFDSFSVEAVYAYLVKVSMLERWEKLDVEQGKETFTAIIEGLRGEARVPAEFL